MTPLPRLEPDFKDFLRLLNSNEVEYLLIGGYAVGWHGYVRYTGDLDIWIRVHPDNAIRAARAVQEFGFPEARAETFLEIPRIMRMGQAPVRIEISTRISGVDFEECYSRRQIGEIDGVKIPVIDLPDLLRNKRASGRPKDLADLDNLPKLEP